MVLIQNIVSCPFQGATNLNSERDKKPVWQVCLVSDIKEIILNFNSV